MRILAEQALIVKKILFRVTQIILPEVGEQENGVMIPIMIEDSSFILRVDPKVAFKMERGRCYKAICVFNSQYTNVKHIFYLRESDAVGDCTTPALIDESSFWAFQGLGKDLTLTE